MGPTKPEPGTRETRTRDQRDLNLGPARPEPGTSETRTRIPTATRHYYKPDADDAITMQTP